MRALTKRLVRSSQGTAAIEFAMIVPVMLALTAAMVEFGSIFAVYNQTNRLAAQYAAAWSDCSDFPTPQCLTELNTYTTPAAVTNIAPKLTATGLTLQMFQVSMSGSTPTVVYAAPAGATLSASQIAALTATVPSGQKGVLVSTAYQHQLMFFPKPMTTFLGSLLKPSYTVVQLKS